MGSFKGSFERVYKDYYKGQYGGLVSKGLNNYHYKFGRSPYYNYPKGPCTHIAYTWAPKYLNTDYMKAHVYTI